MYHLPSFIRRTAAGALALPLLAIAAGPLGAQARRAAASVPPSGIPLDSAIRQLKVRSLGPANMQGRLTDVEGVPGNPDLLYVGAAAGGVWKTTNGGTTWTPIFDGQPMQSIGDLALEPGNPDVVYVGTGESNVRNTVSYGTGVFKTTDGGTTWTDLGLHDTRHIARVLVHPTRKQTVYVCAIGHIAGPNTERGVFVSEDGGATWSKTLYLDDRHGCADLDQDPQNPNILYASLWYFDRKQWTFTSGDTLGGIWKSVDAGRTWKKLEGGLPTLMGRIGVKVAPSEPNVVYAATEAKDAVLWRSDDRGETWTKMHTTEATMCRGFYYADLRVDPANSDRVYMIGCSLSLSTDRGKTFARIANGTHGDYQGMWIDPTNPSLVWFVDDGGLWRSRDHARTWEHHNNFSAAQLYQLAFDLREPLYHLSGGFQDNGNWTGPSRTREPNGNRHRDWRMVSYGDGYYSVFHPDDPDIQLTDAQGGWIWRTNLRTLEQEDVSPQPRRADGETPKDLQYRFNWNAPIVPSPHDGKVVYFGAQVLFRSKDFGSTWEIISPDLSKHEPDKQGGAGGPVWRENTTAEYYANIYEVRESPVQRGLIWAGTDDGNLQVTQDDGKTWTNVAPNVKGVGPSAVASALEASRTGACTAYAGFERHLMDDYAPYVFKTTDCGRTWRNLSAGLPDGAYVQVIREDPFNPDLVYLGTERGLFASFTGGGNWVRLALDGLPPAPVHEVLVHPRERDLIIATHGRGIYTLDDATPLQQLAGGALAKGVHVFPTRTATRFAMKTTMVSGEGQREYRAENPPYGAAITYVLGVAADSAPRAEIRDASGRLVRTLDRLPKARGVNRAWWGLDEEPSRPRRARRAAADDDEEDFFGGPSGPRALPGTYTVAVIAGRDTATTTVTVRLDPTSAATPDGLRRQHAAGVRLRDMQSALNDTLRALDAYKDALAARKRAAEALPDGAGAAEARELAALVAQVDSVVNETVKPRERGYYAEGPRIGERLSGLLRALDAQNGAPTAAQQKLQGELEIEWKAALDRATRVLRGGRSVSAAPSPRSVRRHPIG